MDTYAERRFKYQKGILQGPSQLCYYWSFGNSMLNCRYESEIYFYYDGNTIHQANSN